MRTRVTSTFSSFFGIRWRNGSARVRCSGVVRDSSTTFTSVANIRTYVSPIFSCNTLWIIVGKGGFKIILQPCPETTATSTWPVVLGRLVKLGWMEQLAGIIAESALENSKENRCLPQLCTWKIGFCLAVARSIDNYKIEKRHFPST